MTKLRVHELAKELGMENKDLMEILEKRMWRRKLPWAPFRMRS